MVGPRVAISKRVRRSHLCLTLSSLWLKARLARINGDGITEMAGWSHILWRNFYCSNSLYWTTLIFSLQSSGSRTIAKLINIGVVKQRSRHRRNYVLLVPAENGISTWRHATTWRLFWLIRNLKSGRGFVANFSRKKELYDIDNVTCFFRKHILSCNCIFYKPNILHAKWSTHVNFKNKIMQWWRKLEHSHTYKSTCVKFAGDNWLWDLWNM